MNEEEDAAKLATFRKMIKDSKSGLVCKMEIEDEILTRFMRRPSGNLAKAFKRLETAVETLQNQSFSEIIDCSHPSAVRHVLSENIFGVLRSRDQLGRKVIWLRLGRWNPSEVSDRDLFCALALLGWELLSSKTTQLKGCVGILDLSGCSLTHLRQASPLKILECIRLFSRLIPLHIRALHIVSAPIKFFIGFSAVKPLLPERFRKVVHLHGKKSLREYVPARILPNFLDGLLRECDATDYAIVRTLLGKDNYYKSLVSFGKPKCF